MPIDAAPLVRDLYYKGVTTFVARCSRSGQRLLASVQPMRDRKSPYFQDSNAFTSGAGHMTDSDRDVEPGREAIAQRTSMKRESSVAIVDPESILLRHRIYVASGDARFDRRCGLRSLASKPSRNLAGNP
jgi:hypothetical protein